MGGDARRLGRWPRAWRKVMAAYRRVYGFGHLRADCRGPGSATEPYGSMDYVYLNYLNVVTHLVAPEHNLKVHLQRIDFNGLQ